MLLKVKLNFVLLGVVRNWKYARMSCDDNYVLDADGKRILIGLTLDETREFERLDELMSLPSFVPTDDSRSLNERRWLVLYDKHEAAVRLYLSNQNAEALKALRGD